GDPADELDGLLDSIRAEGVLVPLVVVRDGDAWQVLSGHRRLACARVLGLPDVPCQPRAVPDDAERRRAVLEYNRQRRKSFSQLMREADALDDLLAAEARRRRQANLRQNRPEMAERRDSDDRAGRTDV